MKKKILLCFCLVVSISAMAQHIQYGAAAGVTYYSMKGEATGYLNKALNFTNGTISSRPVTGFYSGGYVTVPVATNFSVEPGLYYSSKGYAITGKYALKGIDILSVSPGLSRAPSDPKKSSVCVKFLAKNISFRLATNSKSAVTFLL